MLCDDAVDLLEIGKDHIADDAVLDGCHGVAVLQHFLTVVMSQVTVESAGDVGVTASDPVDHIDAVVRRFTVVAVFLRRVDDGGKVVLLRSDDSALSRGNHGDRIFFTEGLLDLLNRAGLAEGQRAVSAEQKKMSTYGRMDSMHFLASSPLQRFAR